MGVLLEKMEDLEEREERVERVDCTEAMVEMEGELGREVLCG